LIAFKFGAEFHYVTAIRCKCSRSEIKDQGQRNVSAAKTL